MSGDLQQLGPTLPVTGTEALRVAFWTLGCRLNQYDTESLRATMSGRFDVEVVPWSEPAHLYVLNSCTVTGKADQECRRLARQIKRRHPESKVVVTGCYAQTQPDALARMPEIDGVVGISTKDDVETWMPAVMGGDLPTISVEEFAARPEFDSPLIDGVAGRSRTFVKIQDGCNLRCTYCLIWRARGPGRSRKPDNVLEQLRRLDRAGYRESILAGIHLGGYGRDLRPRVPFTALLRRCLEELPDLRIRLSSIHPNEVTPELLALFAAEPRLRRHLHISLQSGSDGVLKRMKRPYRGQRAWDAMNAVSAVAPHFGIGADVIVGFPGETAKEFEETRRMVAELPFSYLHVFRFSRRPGTAAAEMADQVHPEAITERSAILRELAGAKQAAFRQALVGTEREAVLEAESDVPGQRQATTDNYETITVPDDTAAGLGAGALVRAHIAELRDGRLFANVTGVLTAGGVPATECD